MQVSNKSRSSLLLASAAAVPTVAMVSQPASAAAPQSIADVNDVVVAVSGIMGAAILISISVMGFRLASSTVKKLIR